MSIAQTASRAAPLRIGLGVTAMERAMQASGHLDGIGVYTAELLKHFHAAGMRPACFAHMGSGPRSRNAGITPMPGFFHLNELRHAVTGRAHPTPPGFEDRIDLFHAPDHFVPKFSRVPVLASVMDPIPLMFPQWTPIRFQKLRTWMFRKSVRSADHLVTISRFVVDDIAKHFDVPHERISTVELGVDETYFQPMPDAQRLAYLDAMGLKAPFLLSIGTLQPRKNVLGLIKAFNTLPADIRRGCPLVVAGREGWASAPDRAALASLTAEKTGRWLDYVTPEQKMALLQSARALVFPSLYEGFGLPVLEAFASGLPVVASNTTSIPEVAGNAALLVNPIDVEQLAHAMRRVIEDDGLHAELRDAGRVRARSFTWARTAERTAVLYEQIVR